MTAPIIWVARCPLPTALSFAVHTGLLARHLAPLGVAVESVRHSSDPAVRLSHFTHTLPGMMRHGGHIPPLWSRAAGRDVRLIGLSWTDEAQFVLVRPDADIASLADLRGRRIAVPRRYDYPVDFWRATVLKGFADALALAGLTLEDVSPMEIEIAQIPFGERGPGATTSTPPGTALMTLASQRDEALALLRGEVDAIFSPGHYGVALRAAYGLRTLADLAEQPDRFARLNNPTLLAFTVEGAFLDRYPDAVQSALAASLEGADMARASPDLAGRIVGAESGNAEELVPSIFGQSFSADLAPRIDDPVIEALDRQTHWLHRAGFIPRAVPIGEWLDPSPLKRAVAERDALAVQAASKTPGLTASFLV